MTDSNKPKDEISEIQMSEAAKKKPLSDQPSEIMEAEPTEIQVQPTPQSIIQTSENAWITGTKVLQKNLIRGLQDYQTGIFQLKEKSLLSKKRQEMINQVTDQYIRFLKEEARLASDVALEAHRTALNKQLLEMKASMYVEIADIIGVTAREIEVIFQTHYSGLTDENIKQKYARFVMEKLADLLETSVDND